MLEPMRARGTLINVVKTLALDPVVLEGFMGWARYIAMNSQLAPRDREIVILRIGYLCRSGYEWTQHVEMGMDAGLTAEEVERIKCRRRGPGLDRGRSRPVARQTSCTTTSSSATRPGPR